MGDLSRRAFLRGAAVTAAVISLPVLQVHADDVKPNSPPASPGSAAPIDAGLLSAFDKDGVSDKLAKSNKIFLIREDGKLYATTTLCTHKNFPLIVKDNELYCTKHKSEFSFQGTVTGGPAKRSLPRYAITLNDDKHVMVDKSKQFTEKEWDDASSFIKIDA